MPLECNTFGARQYMQGASGLYVHNQTTCSVRTAHEPTKPITGQKIKVYSSFSDFQKTGRKSTAQIFFLEADQRYEGLLSIVHHISKDYKCKFLKTDKQLHK